MSNVYRCHQILEEATIRIIKQGKRGWCLMGLVIVREIIDP